MKILSIAFGRTLSDGNFGGHRGDVTIEVAEGDCAQACMNKAKDFVLKNLNDDMLEESGNDPRPQTTQQELPVVAGDSVLAKEVEKNLEEKPVKKVAKKVAKKAAKKVTKKAAHVAYDRTLQPHKTMFLAMATELGLRDGKTPEDKAALKETSTFMEGKEMFEAGSTDILKSFKEMATHQFNEFKEAESAEA